MLEMAVGQTEEIEGRLAAEDVVRQCSAALEAAAPPCGLVLASHDLELLIPTVERLDPSPTGSPGAFT